MKYCGEYIEGEEGQLPGTNCTLPLRHRGKHDSSNKIPATDVDSVFLRNLRNFDRNNLRNFDWNTGLEKKPRKDAYLESKKKHTVLNAIYYGIRDTIVWVKP